MNKALLKKHKWLLGIGAVLLIALALTGWKLFEAATRFNAAKQHLQSVTARLAQLNNRNPFPSPENVERERKNFEEMVDIYNELNDRLQAGQVTPRRMEASDFMPVLEKTLRSLRAGFRANRIEIPSKFNFGFDKYAGGQLPAPDDIPRMVQQLKIIETLCQSVMDSRLTELLDITREEFESPEPSTVARRGRTMAPAADAPRAPDMLGPEELFAGQRFVVTLRGSEPAVMDFLNRLATMPMFTLVTAVEMRNRRQTIRNEAAAAAAEKTAATADPKERPVLIGREDIEAKIAIEVYQFAPSLDWESKQPL